MGQLNSHVCHIIGKVSKSERDVVYEICVKCRVASMSFGMSADDGYMLKLMADDESYAKAQEMLKNVFTNRIEFDVYTIESEQYGKKETSNS